MHRVGNLSRLRMAKGPPILHLLAVEVMGQHPGVSSFLRAPELRGPFTYKKLRPPKVCWRVSLKMPAVKGSRSLPLIQ